MPQTKGLGTGLLLLFTSLAFTQQIRFKEPYKSNGNLQQIVEFNGHYFALGQIYNQTTGNFGINLLKLDSFGQVKKEKRFIDTTGIIFPSNHISLEKTLDESFIAVFDVVNSMGRSNGILKYDPNLDTLALWRPITDSIARAFYQVKQLPDSGFVITGYWYDQPKNMYHANLIRTDKQGQLLWEKVIKRQDSISLHPYQVYLAPGGGFLLAGRRVYLPDGQTQDPLLIRTDSAGNLLWKKTYGGPRIDGVATAAYRDDGDIMLHYTQSYQATLGGDLYYPVFAIINDTTGAVRQIKKMTHFTYPEEMFSHNLLKDGDKYIASGQLDDIRPPMAGGFKQAYTLAVDQNLQGLWYRQYHAQGPNAPVDDWSVLYDLRPTSDGGYIGGGYLKTGDTTHLNVHLGFNGWIVKMDSMGCVVQSCVNSIGAEEVAVASAKEIDIYPNPSTGPIHITMKESANGRAELYDLKGVRLQETEIKEGKGSLNSGAEFPPGVYVVRVVDDAGYAATAKVIVQR